MSVGWALLVAGALAATPARSWHSAVRELTTEEVAAMTGVVWRPGCPVALGDLVRVEVALASPDGSGGEGAIVVHRSAAEVVEGALHTLWELDFPIARMEPIEAYGGDDTRSMEANNSSGFNCRPKTGGGGWSRHSYGTAVDLNPLWNPWVKGERVEPAAARPWADRMDKKVGMFLRESTAVRAFTDRGWRWGGSWGSAKDYQHFSADGT